MFDSDAAQLCASLWREMCRDEANAASPTLFSPETQKMMAAVELIVEEHHRDQENAQPQLPAAADGQCMMSHGRLGQVEVIKPTRLVRSASAASVASPAAATPPLRPARRRRKVSGDEDEMRVLARVARAPVKQPQPASRRRSCASRTVGTVLLLALVAASALCAVLLVAILAGAALPKVSTDASTLTIGPPCDPPLPNLPALPMPPQCKWSWLTFRCRPAVYCSLKVHWLPVPHPTCRMRP